MSKTSETFDSNSNKWIPLANMGVQRGRFSVASVGGFIYAVGGSDGFREQRELEYYDPNQKYGSLVEKPEMPKCLKDWHHLMKNCTVLEDAWDRRVPMSVMCMTPKLMNGKP